MLDQSCQMSVLLLTDESWEKFIAMECSNTSLKDVLQAR